MAVTSCPSQAVKSSGVRSVSPIGTTVASFAVEQRAVTATPADDADGATRSTSLRFLVSPRWILFHLLVIGGVVLMLNLSLWQWHRLDERREFNALVDERRQEPTVPYVELMPAGDGAAASPSPADVEWRATAAVGRYDTDHPIVVVNRSQNGQAGANVVSPLVLDDGRVLLVNRGFLPLAALDRQLPPPPTGEVQVAGRLRASEVRRTGQLSSTAADDSPSGAIEVPRLDITELEQLVGDDLEPVWLSVSGDETGAPLSRPADDPMLAPIAEPELSEGPHLSYAVQWLIFSVCVIVGWVFAVRRSVRSRRRAAVAVSEVG